MTLRQALRSLEPETKIKVGAINGTAWFYIGTNDDLEHNFAEYDSAIMRMWRKKLANAKETLRTILTSTVTIESYVRSQIYGKGKPDFTVEGYRKHVEDCFRTIKLVHAMMVRCREIIDNPIALSTRPVVDVYKSDIKTEKEYTQIRIEGFEQGVYWTSEEAEKIPVVKFNMTSGEKDADETEEDNGTEI